MQTNSLYQKWLDSPRLTSKEKSQLASLSEQEIALYFSEKPLLYGTAGVRAKMGLGTQRLNRFTYAQLAYGYGRYVRNTFGVNATIIIGHDNRLNSDSFAYLCAQVLSSLGINVLLFGRNRLMPTPIVSYAIRTVKASGGIIITASHNPSEYNGFKAYNPDGGQVLPKVAKKIEDYTPGASELLNINYATQNNRINYLSNHMVCKRYFEDATTALVNPVSTVFKKPYPVVFTGHHGTTVKLIPRFLAKLRYHIKPVKKQSFYSPTFVNSPCANPEDPESFALAIKYAEKVHSNIIIGVDPDGDRMAIMIKHDNQWRLMSGNEMGIIYTHYVLKHKRYTSIPYVIASYVSNNLVDRIVAKKGGKVYRTGTGFKWMGALISEFDDPQNLIVAFEEAIGALVTPINRDKDAFTAAALSLEIYHDYRHRQMDFVDILNREIYPEYGHWYGCTKSYLINDPNWQEIGKGYLKKLTTFTAGIIGAYKIRKIEWNKYGDCLDWILNGDNWIRFRLSGTEPKFKIYYNLYASSQALAIKEYNSINETLLKLLGIKEN